MAAIGSLFRFVASPQDAIWLPAAIDPARLPAYEQAGQPTWVSGGPSDVLKRFSDRQVIPWADARPWVSEKRASIAARVNERLFGMGLGRELEAADPGHRLVSSVAELRQHLRAERIDSWVVKAPFSAAGRHRYIRRRPAISSPDTGLEEETENRRLEGLFARHGRLLFEPWRRRLLDVGVLFDVGNPEERPRLHRQLVDRTGSVTTIDFGPRVDAMVLPDDRRRLMETAHHVSTALAAAGYRGPAGLDAWQYATPEGPRWNFLGEINARWSIGRLARAVAARLATQAGDSAVNAASEGREENWCLQLGPQAGELPAEPWRRYVLALPDETGHGTISMMRSA